MSTEASESANANGVVVGVDPHGISYEKAAEYWSGVQPTIDGMLGGFGKISG